MAHCVSLKLFLWGKKEIRNTVLQKLKKISQFYRPQISNVASIYESFKAIEFITPLYA